MNTPAKQQVIAQSATEKPPMKLGEELDSRTSEFAGSLPAHIPVERFKKVIIAAVNSNPALIKADRRTFFTSAMKAANDGLLPDGREGALVIYKTKVNETVNGKAQERWVDAVQWMPMIAGIRKKVRNSGEIATWDAQVVYAKDAFDYELGDSPFIKHKPSLDPDPGAIVAAYSVATLKSGEKSREVMTVAQIEKVRAISKTKDSGPWKTHYGEMCRKTVARRHSKVLPMSTDLDDLIRRDDALYDFEGKSDKATPASDTSPPRPQITDYTDVPQDKHAETVNAETGEITTESEGPAADEDEATTYGNADAYKDGQTAFKEGVPREKAPAHLAQLGFAEPWQAGWDDAQAEYDASLEAKASTGKLV